MLQVDTPRLGLSESATRPSVFKGDCLRVIPGKITDGSVDLVITSPPYADRRKNTYGGVHPDQYVDWFLPRSEVILNCLNPGGSFILNIKERVVNGERHTYVLDLIHGMRAQGWRWVEEYCWHKKNCYPGKWSNRFRDSWERVLHFTRSEKFKMRQDAVRVPMGNWRSARLRNLSETDRVRDNSRTMSNFGKRVANWEGRDWAYPTNVLHMATECSNRGHPATFPESLPDWFIRLFTDSGDVVLDPFAGSGTTLVAAHRLGRSSVGIDMSEEYCRLMRERIRAL
ncbi:MAG: site-specific DNA-methyltransferase [Alphaproteobacteria bacterium]|nr:site-specific DNA-methyltransferase [Alphaproteobacteria bacterium]MDA8000426.1 site-specific DNA-methyltransferase [Alphaproteobacteria bacterium]MDA8004308.1 site-specific DNA-methyltransferase [Alphaproteobacteria bacterium]MDA8005782.1 site-specific DNA-methyltransferase [Alphaproteobacteria bacterium]MDA8013170.1 site-specific DNA-methyltransferase [Alphaproteobacteria bacterium]